MLTTFIKAYSINVVVKGEKQGLRGFLTTESPLKMMKNVFLFYLKSFLRS